jgi:hypothetical protein
MCEFLLQRRLALKITKVDTEIFHHVARKKEHFGIRRRCATTATELRRCND